MLLLFFPFLNIGKTLTFLKFSVCSEVCQLPQNLGGASHQGPWTNVCLVCIRIPWEYPFQPKVSFPWSSLSPLCLGGGISECFYFLEMTETKVALNTSADSLSCVNRSSFCNGSTFSSVFLLLLTYLKKFYFQSSTSLDTFSFSLA